MIENLSFISALSGAVTGIAASDWATWSAAHSGDTYFSRINERLLVLEAYYKQASIDALCAYLVANSLIPSAQSVPSALFWPYKLNSRFATTEGVIQKRGPRHRPRGRSGALVGAPGSWRWGTWQIFQKAIDCLWAQPTTGGQTDREEGPMARSTWYAQSAGSGLFWLNYFMQATLDYMYGESKPNDWPFVYRCPPWCVTKHYRFNLKAYGDEGFAGLNMVYFPPAGQSYGSGCIAHIFIKPDTSKPDPGHMDVGSLYSQQASMNTDYEVWGDYSDLTIAPLPAVSTPMNLAVTQYDGDPWLFQFLEFRDMVGYYNIDIFVSSNLNFNEPEGVFSETLGGDWY